MKSIRIFCCLLFVCAMLTLVLSGCTPADDSTAIVDSEDLALLPLTIATVPTDDLLPLWVAQAEGITDELGLDIEILLFTSGREMMAALIAGEAQGGSLSMVQGYQLAQGGVPVMAITREGPSRGAIISSPQSGITSTEQLSGVAVAATEESLEEYVLDRALEDAGVPREEVTLEAVPSLPARTELLMGEHVKAIMVPWTFASLLEAKGAHILVDEKQIEPYTSTVLAVRMDWLDKPQADATIEAIWEAWNQGKELINANPEKYLPLLAEKANLPAEAVESYEMQVYAPAQLPSKEQVESVFDWAYAKGYINEVMTYDEFVYQVK